MYGRKKIGFLINRDHIEREREREERMGKRWEYIKKKKMKVEGV